jgi:hypothetical protein
MSPSKRLGVRHETPQAILLRDGKPVWKASHFRITADALAQAPDAFPFPPFSPAARARPLP